MQYSCLSSCQKVFNKKEASQRFIKQSQLNTAEELKQKADSFYNSQDFRDVLDSLKNSSIELKFINPFRYKKHEFLNLVLYDMVNCEPLHKHIKHTRMSKCKLLHDAQLGGSIHIIGRHEQTNNRPYSFRERLFTCVSYKNELVLFMDCIEGGPEYFNCLDHWRGMDEYCTRKISYSRIDEQFYGIAAAIYVAKQLNINYIIPRDYELKELATILGMPEKRIFLKGVDRKKGINSKRKKTGVYTHTLYRGTKQNNSGREQLRFQTHNILISLIMVSWCRSISY